MAVARAGMAAAPYAPFCCQLWTPKEYFLHMPHVHCLRQADLGGAMLAYTDFCNALEEGRLFPVPASLGPILLTFHCLCLRRWCSMGGTGGRTCAAGGLVAATTLVCAFVHGSCPVAYNCSPIAYRWSRAGGRDRCLMGITATGRLWPIC